MFVLYCNVHVFAFVCLVNRVLLFQIVANSTQQDTILTFRKLRCCIKKSNLREGDHLEDQGVDGRIILKWIFESLDGGMDWINLAQDRDR
jgi:hypothetical protein